MISVLLLIIVVGGFYFLFSSQTQDINQNRDQLETSMNRLRIMSTRLSKKKILKEEYTVLLEELENRQKNFLEQGKESDLLLDLNNLAMKYNVKMLSIEPKKITQEDIYFKVPAEVRLIGAYDQIVNYIEGVKQLDYLTRIEDLNLNVSNNPDYLEAKITLLGYALDRKGERK